MDYILLLRPEARIDLLDAFQWYQEQQDGLGHDFKFYSPIPFREGARRRGKFKTNPTLALPLKGRELFIFLILFPLPFRDNQRLSWAT